MDRTLRESLTAASSRPTSNFASGGTVTLAGGFFLRCLRALAAAGCRTVLFWAAAISLSGCAVSRRTSSSALLRETECSVSTAYGSWYCATSFACKRRFEGGVEERKKHLASLAQVDSNAGTDLQSSCKFT